MNSKTTTYQRYGNFIINKSESLGSGNFGHVWKGYLIGPNNSLERVAIKQSYNETQNIKQIQTLQVLKHPNIIRYRDYRVAGNQVFMVMELCQGGTLDDLLYSMQNHDTGKLIELYSQIIKGIKFMYENKILHRDIKPSNLLVTKSNVIKIADFGTSKMNKSGQLMLKTLVGTPLFFSPELLQMSLGEEDTYTQKSQIWALGLILYYMFNYQYNLVKPADRMKESLPWSGRNPLEILKSIKSQPLKFKKPQQIPQQIQQIITKMLKVNAQERMSFKQLFNIQIFKKPDTQSYFSQYSEGEERNQQRTINEIKKETIDWELLEILEKNEQQICNDEEMEEYRQFYQLLIHQLTQINEPKYNELMFQLELQYFHLTSKLEQKSNIKQKYVSREIRFREIEQQAKLKTQNQSLDFITSVQSEYTATKFDRNQSLIIPIPNQNLLNESKNFIKENIDKILNKKSAKNIDLDITNIINLIYDLFTLITFEKSWEIKKKTKASIQNYKRMRRLVKIDTILTRIIKAYESIKL